MPKPLRKKIGAWVEMEFDAAIRVRGIRWLRVRGGLGGEFRHEDWVADVPAICCSVHDYHWNGDDFGPNYGSFLGAIRAEMKLSLDYAIYEAKKLRKKARAQAEGAAVLRKALAKAKAKAEAGPRLEEK